MFGLSCICLFVHPLLYIYNFLLSKHIHQVQIQKVFSEGAQLNSENVFFLVDKVEGGSKYHLKRGSLMAR